MQNNGEIRTPRCANCAFYVKPPTDELAHCRRYPPFGAFIQKTLLDHKTGKPVVDLMTGAPRVVASPASAFPPTQPQFFCGEWKRQEAITQPNYSPPKEPAENKKPLEIPAMPVNIGAKDALDS